MSSNITFLEIKRHQNSKKKLKFKIDYQTFYYFGNQNQWLTSTVKFVTTGNTQTLFWTNK